MICNEEHCLFIFVCSIFARHFELSNVRSSRKLSQATRLAVFRGSAAGVSLKATKYPERTRRALNEVPRVSTALHLARPLAAGDCRMHGPFTLVTPVL